MQQELQQQEDSETQLLLLLLLLSGLVLVTDAVMAMGLPPGLHTLGQQVIEIQGLHAYVAGPCHLWTKRFLKSMFKAFSSGLKSSFLVF